MMHCTGLREAGSFGNIIYAGGMRVLFPLWPDHRIRGINSGVGISGCCIAPYNRVIRGEVDKRPYPLPGRISASELPAKANFCFSAQTERGL